MKILHTSDWHLGKVLHERSLLDDQRVMLGQLVQHLADDPHDLLLIAGDVFDRTVPPEEAVELLGGFFDDLRAACPGLPVVIIAGNHDSGARLAWGAGIFARQGIHLRGDDRAIEAPITVEAGGVAVEVWAVPFLWTSSASADRDGNRPLAKTQSEALDRAVAAIRPRQTAGRRQILVAHCFASGGTVSESERNLVGQATQIDASLFEGFDYVALGHLHRPQSVGANAAYSGSPLKYSFSEATDTKVFLSVSLDAVGPMQVVKVPVRAPRPMSVLRGDYGDLLTDPKWLEFADHYVRIDLIEATASQQPAAILRQRFPHLLDFRMPIPASATSAMSRSTAAHRGHDDIDADFTEFEKALRGDDPLAEGVESAFAELRDTARKEVRA